MIYLLIVILFLLCLVDYLKNRKILSPSFVFNFIWFITLFLYQFKLSYLQQDLSSRTTLIFFICVISYNAFLFLFHKLKLKTWSFKFNPKNSIDKKVKIAKYIVIVLFAFEVIYCGGVPLIWKLTGSAKNYFNFGIPSLHGALNGLIICLGAYSLYKKSKDSVLYLLIGILMISRQVLISMVLEGVVLLFYKNKEKIKIKHLVVGGIVILLGFTLLGNFRSGNNVMHDVFKPKEQYQSLPDTAKWIYSYMTFSVSNFNNLVSKTDGFVNYGASMLSELVPTVILNIVNIKPNESFHYLVSLNYTVSTYLPNIYLDFGIVGIAIFNILMAFLGYQLYLKAEQEKSIKNILLYSVFVHNIVFLFFINMFLYLPVLVQFIYIPFIFSEKDKGKERTHCLALKKKMKKIKNTDLISIVVPVYNVESYLERCIKSLINQTYKNIEILLIDDGSFDKSADICDRYAEKYDFIKTFHKKNGGLSDARNYGIKKASGKYICFIDSDDYIEDEMLANMYYDMKENDSDIVCCGKILDYPSNSISVNNCDDFCVDANIALKKMLLKDDIDNSVCDKLFKIELFNNIKFPKGRYYEDIATVYKLFICSNKISHISYLGYHYCIRNNSISTEEFSNKQFDSLIFSKKMMEDSIAFDKKLRIPAESFYYLELMTILRKLKRSSNFNSFQEEYRMIKKEFNRCFGKILINSCIPYYKKIMSCFIYVNLFVVVDFFYKIISSKK